MASKQYDLGKHKCRGIPYTLIQTESEIGDIVYYAELGSECRTWNAPSKDIVHDDVAHLIDWIKSKAK